MNRKQLTILLVFGIIIGGLGFWAYQKQKAPYQDSTQKMGEKLVPNFPLNDVAQVALKQRNGELTLTKKDETWVVSQRGDYPANFSNIRELLMKIGELKIAKPVRVGPSRLPQLELLSPDKCASTTVEFKDGKGKAITSLLLGAKHTREGRGGDSPFGGGGGGFPDGRYVMVGNDLQTVALISDPLSNTEPKAEEWLNKDWFKVEKLRSIAITTSNATNNWVLARASETNEWKLAEVKAGEPVDNSKFATVTSALSSPAFNDVATNTDKAGLDKPLLAKLETLDGFTYDIKVGGKTGEDSYYMQMAVTGSIPKERTVGKDEKPDDKAKLDKEFNDRKAKLEEKLKAEKAFEKWTYVVSKWTIEPLLKERKDFMQEKKEEKKDEANPANVEGK